MKKDKVEVKPKSVPKPPVKKETKSRSKSKSVTSVKKVVTPNAKTIKGAPKPAKKTKKIEKAKKATVKKPPAKKVTKKATVPKKSVVKKEIPEKKGKKKVNKRGGAKRMRWLNALIYEYQLIIKMYFDDEYERLLESIILV